MSPAIDLWTSSRLGRTMIVLCFVLLVLPFVYTSIRPDLTSPAISGGELTILGVAVAIPLDVGLALLARARGSDSAGSVWDVIPSRRYGGRHAESGGLAREEPERALDRLRDETE